MDLKILRKPRLKYPKSPGFVLILLIVVVTSIAAIFAAALRF